MNHPSFLVSWFWDSPSFCRFLVLGFSLIFFLSLSLSHPIPNTHTHARSRRTEDLLAIEFEQGPLDHLADSRVRLRSRPLNVVFNGNVVNRILHFFVDSSNSMANEDLYNAATSQVSAARAFGTASLQHAIDEHKTLDIDMDVQSPLIIIPQDCTTADCPHLVVDLGRLVVQSELTQVRFGGRTWENEGRVAWLG